MAEVSFRTCFYISLNLLDSTGGLGARIWTAGGSLTMSTRVILGAAGTGIKHSNLFLYIFLTQAESEWN